MLHHGSLDLPEQLRYRRIAPHQLKHSRLALGEIDLELPFAIPLHVEMRRVVVVRPEPASQARYLKASDLGHPSLATANSLPRERTFFNRYKTGNVRSRK